MKNIPSLFTHTISKSHSSFVLWNSSSRKVIPHFGGCFTKHSWNEILNMSIDFWNTLNKFHPLLGELQNSVYFYSTIFILLKFGYIFGLGQKGNVYLFFWCLCVCLYASGHMKQEDWKWFSNSFDVRSVWTFFKLIFWIPHGRSKFSYPCFVDMSSVSGVKVDVKSHRRRCKI